MSRDLILAILAMDSYNRGYGQGIMGLPVSGALGRATIFTDSRIELGATDTESVGFYALAYDMSAVIGFCYRREGYFVSRNEHQ